MKTSQGAVAACAVVVAVLVTGCGSSGSATSCTSFEGMGASGERTAITNALKSHGQAASPVGIDEGVLSAKAYCAFHSGDSPIGSIFK